MRAVENMARPPMRRGLRLREIKLRLRPHKSPLAWKIEVVSPGQAYVPAGFGEGSLWATDIATCDDTSAPSASAGSYGSSVESFVAVSLASCALPAKLLLKRLDARSGEEEAVIQLKGFSANTVKGKFGAGSLWVRSGDWSAAADGVLRVDPETNRVVDRISVDSPTGLAFGHGSVWAASAGHGTVSRIDPRTGEVVAQIEVGRGAVGIASDESLGALWIASTYLPKTRGVDDNPNYSEDNNLTRIDPETNRVVEEIPIEAHSRYGGGAINVAVGEGAVWVLSENGKLLKVDPATNEIAGMVPVVGDLGAEPPHLAVYGGGVWAMAEGREYRLVRVDPQTMHIVASEDIGSVGALAAGGGYVWFSSKEGLVRVSP